TAAMTRAWAEKAKTPKSAEMEPTPLSRMESMCSRRSKRPCSMGFRLMFPIRCHETQPPSRRDAEEDAESAKQNEFLGAFLCVLGVSAVAFCPCCYPLEPDWRHEPNVQRGVFRGHCPPPPSQQPVDNLACQHPRFAVKKFLRTVSPLVAFI